jgi:hypothetical protein
MLSRRSCELVLFLLFVAHASFVALAIEQKFDEYQVKAAFICNFANFVEWPQAAFKSPRDPFSVCVLGRNPFGRTLELLTKGRVVDGHDFLVRQVGDVSDACGCHILFISSSERLRFRSILQELKASSTLSVGDTNDFIAKGGVVDLKLEGGKVRVEINPQAANDKGLRISSHLLDLAKISK